MTFKQIDDQMPKFYAARNPLFIAFYDSISKFSPHFKNVKASLWTYNPELCIFQNNRHCLGRVVLDVNEEDCLPPLTSGDFVRFCREISVNPPCSIKILILPPNYK
jgi:hypothetical protein